MTQTQLTTYTTATTTPPKPALKTSEDTTGDADGEYEYRTIVHVQAWSETTFREQAKRTLEALHYIDDARHDELIDELTESQSPIETELNDINHARLYGHVECIEIQTTAINAAVNSEARTLLVTPGLAQLGRGIEEIREHLTSLLRHDVTVILPAGRITPGCEDAVAATLSSINAAGDRIRSEPRADELVKDDADRWTGRAPTGFDVVNGQLQKSDDYADVRRTLKAVIADETTKAAAARRLDCSAKTITRCIEDHPERYQL